MMLGFAALAGASDSAYQQAWSLADEARATARAGDLEAGLDLYRRANELAPEVIEIRRDYATALGWAERHEEASREFSIVFARQPEQPIWAVREKANADLFSGNADDALTGYDRLIATGHYEEPILTRRGMALLRLERHAEAEQQYRQALGWYPESEPSAVGLARALAGQGRLDAAYTLAVTWGAQKPADAEIRIVAAEMLVRLGRYQEAAEAFEQVSPRRLRGTGAEWAATEARRWVASAEESSPTVAALERRSLTPPMGTVSGNPAEQAAELRQRGVEIARAGDPAGGLPFLEQALKISPEDPEVLIDYAIVLGWQERYLESLGQFEKAFRHAPEQPAWVRSELARNQLFGGRTVAALATLDQLIAEGHRDVGNLSRKALALRWMGRSEEAAALYRHVRAAHPGSPEGHRGLVQALADRNRFSDALDAAADGLQRFSGDEELILGRAQVLNWAGRHISARRVLEELPPAYREKADVLQHRTLAAYWAARPKEAFELARSYRRQHPGDPQAERLWRRISNELGTSLEAQSEVVGDSAGYSYRALLQRATIPLSVSHRLSFDRERRAYEDRQLAPHALSTDRYGLGWTGSLGRRLTAYASASSLQYRSPGAGARRLTADLSFDALLTDRVTVAGGFGVTPAETLPALRERLLGRRAWAEVRLRPTLKLDANVRYERRAFEVATRHTADYSAFFTVSRRGGHRIRLGGRSQWMWHDRPSRLFWSPEFFHTQLAAVRAEGSLPGGFDYAAEVGAGVQHEAGFGKQTPLASTVEAAKRLTPQFLLRVKAGYSNSSIDRINSGSNSYRFGYFSAGLDFRLGRKG